MDTIIMHHYFIHQNEDELKELFNSLIARLFCKLESDDQADYYYECPGKESRKDG